jgi:hypothetical protein
MGAAASVEASDVVPKDFKELYDLIDRLKFHVADMDAKMLSSETAKMFKDHNKIIDTLTSRSKSQMKAFKEKCPTGQKNLDSLISGGNLYAKFISMLAIPKAELEMEALRATEYDEELLINIIGTSSLREIQVLDELYKKEKSMSLLQLISTKCKQDSVLINFMQRVFEYDRDESKKVDEEEAEKQAEMLHTAGAAKLLGVDEDQIFRILQRSSRHQCVLINEAYQRKYKMKLERALNMKFKGNVSKLLIMWAAPLPTAMVHALTFLMQKINPDKQAILLFLAKFDKDVLKLADSACKELQKKSIADFLSTAITANVLRAVRSWIELQAPDKGLEHILHVYIDSKLIEGYTMSDVFLNAEILAKCQFILTKLGNELRAFLSENKMKLTAVDEDILSRSSSMMAGGLEKTISVLKSQQSSHSLSSDLLGTAGHHQHHHSPKAAAIVEVEESEEFLSGKELMSLGFSSVAEGEETGTGGTGGGAEDGADHLLRYHLQDKSDAEKAEHEQQVNAIYAFILRYYEKADPSAEGCLFANHFWEITSTKLPLRTFHVTSSDIQRLRMYSSWETEEEDEADRRIYYYEALLELADSFVSSILRHEELVFDVLNTLTENQPDELDEAEDVPSSLRLAGNNSNDSGNATNTFDRGQFAFESSSRRRQTMHFPIIPMEFQQYLYDTVSAFDLDCSLRLTENELITLIEVLNITSLNVTDFLQGHEVSGQPVLTDCTVLYCTVHIIYAILDSLHYLC